jgi:hemerythrin-like domain-containing protein
MKNAVEMLISRLRSDHRNMAMLLDSLDAEIDKLTSSGEPDYSLVSDIMLYVTEYPDVVHHPKEDIVYRHLESLRPDIRSDLERVEKDHRFIEDWGLKLKYDIATLSSGTTPGRDELIAELHDYMEQLREHMYWEETELFSLADELQHYGDWSDVILANNEISDPLFGSQVERKYGRLLASIQQRVVWDGKKGVWARDRGQ